MAEEDFNLWPLITTKLVTQSEVFCHYLSSSMEHAAYELFQAYVSLEATEAGLKLPYLSLRGIYIGILRAQSTYICFYTVCFAGGKQWSVYK